MNFQICNTTFGTHSLTHSLALRPSEKLGLHNNGCPFFPINCLLSLSLNLPLPLILLLIFQPSQSKSSPSFTHVQFTPKYYTVLPWPSLTTCPFHSNLFFLIPATMARSLYRTWHWKVHVSFFAIYIHSNEIYTVAALIVYWCIGVSCTCFGP